MLYQDFVRRMLRKRQEEENKPILVLRISPCNYLIIGSEVISSCRGFLLYSWPVLGAPNYLLTLAIIRINADARKTTQRVYGFKPMQARGSCIAVLINGK
jgi:hypothetical protein